MNWLLIFLILVLFFYLMLFCWMIISIYRDQVGLYLYWIGVRSEIIFRLNTAATGETDQFFKFIYSDYENDDYDEVVLSMLENNLNYVEKNISDFEKRQGIKCYLWGQKRQTKKLLKSNSQTARRRK